jgi:1-deoxy-D-xylulose-5-phosphate synthase
MGEGVEWKGTPFERLDEGRGECLREGEGVAIISVGTTAGMAMRAIERSGRSVALYDMRYAKPLDISLIEEVTRKFSAIITVEDGILRGGVGEAIAAHFSRHGYTPRVENLGIGDTFIEHGKPAELYADCAYDEEALLKTIERI